jgi:CheY-like chemotaxis protein
LEKAGYTVKSVYDGTTAQKLLAEIVPAIVILDLHMPGVNGDVVLRQIRSDSRLKDIRVIVATSDSTFVASLQFQSELVLLKPIGFSQLSQLASRFAQKSDSPTQTPEK